MISTALRETKEEIGLSPENIQILGLFDDFSTPTGFVITPAVGYVPRLPELRANSREVEEILEVPLAFFLNPENERVVRMQRDGVMRDVFFYTYREGVEIWGATAFILRSFLKSVHARSPSSSVGT